MRNSSSNKGLGIGTFARVVLVMLHCAVPSEFQAQTYTDVSLSNGLNLQVTSHEFGNGVSFYDIDGDGWDDLTFTTSDDSLAVYLNNQGQLYRPPSFLYNQGSTKHVLWVDYDNDGDLDLTITTWEGTYRLYANDGSFHFTDVSVSAGLMQTDAKTNGVAWGDYDRDGDLDLYVCMYENDGGQDTPERFNRLYRNNGEGTFTDVTQPAGMFHDLLLSFQAIWLDHDLDGWPDLYVINDRFYPSYLYRNNGDGTFTDIAAQTGLADTQNPMTASLGDLENDGDLDLFVTNTGPVGNEAMLFKNNGDGTYAEVGAMYGVDLALWAWGATWVDVDNDTWQDLYVTTSFPSGSVENNVLFHSEAGQVFIQEPWAFGDSNFARSFAVGRGDLDNNGYYDLAVQNQSPYFPFLWQNSGGSNHFVKITLQGTASNRLAIGSWIRVFAGGQQYVQYTHCGENYLSQNSQHHIFGLGSETFVDSVQVEYVRGHTDRYYALTVDTNYSFTEGETYPVAITALGDVAFCAGDLVLLDAGEHLGYLWNTGATERIITATASGAYWVTVQGPFGIQRDSDTIHVVVHPLPIIEGTTQNPLCAGDATGSIALQNILGIPPQGVNWSNGADGELLEDVTAGIYQYAFTDINGCVANGSIELTEPPELFVLVTTTPVGSGNDGSVSVTVFGGVPPYSIHLDGSLTGPLTTDVSAGSHTVLVTDAFGCTVEEEAFVENPTGLFQADGRPFSIHPNPVEDKLLIRTDRTIQEILITGADGRQITFGTNPQEKLLWVGSLVPGYYVLNVVLDDGRVVRRSFVKT